MQPLFTIEKNGSDTVRPPAPAPHPAAGNGSAAAVEHPVGHPGVELQRDFASWVAATRPPEELVLGEAGFIYADLFQPTRLAELSRRFFDGFQAADPAAHALFDAYRATGGQGMTPEAVSDALLAAAPHVGRFVARLFKVEAEAEVYLRAAQERHVLWTFKKEFSKKRLFKPSAGQAFDQPPTVAARAALLAIAALDLPSVAPLDATTLGSGSEAEELAIAWRVMALVDVDEVARKAAKAGGAAWTEELHDRARAVRAALASDPEIYAAAGDVLTVAGSPASDAEDAAVVAWALAAIEAWLAGRRRDHHDPAHFWPTFRAPAPVDHGQLVQIRRPDPKLPELFVGPEEHRRERQGFELSDRRAAPRDVESEVDYCLLCHDRDKDSCSKGLRDNKTGAIKKNPLGVDLEGCPLEEKISEMHAMRARGDVLSALALVIVDNPMCPGTGHRICNDCMKACVFQKQEPVNIPQVETSVLTDVLRLPWGVEIYGLLTRWNPLDVRRPHALPYNGKNVLVVGLGPAGYTLAHHLASEGFGVAAVDGLKLEPLPVELTGDATRTPRPIRDYEQLYVELDERLLLGFGGVSEYGITVRWDKNFLTILYLTLARNAHIRTYGGIRFGGTFDLEDAWSYGFDHVAIAAGAGKPTIVPMKNNLSRGIRKASDFLMALQLTGAYKKTALANLQVRLPAIVIGGGLTAIDTATELLAYYVVQVEKTSTRIEQLIAERGEIAVRTLFDAEEWSFLEEERAHWRAIREERARAAAEGRSARLQPLLDSWGGVSLVYRKRLADSPAYRLNHEEVAKSLEEGVRYIENLSPTEAVLDDQGLVKAMLFERQAVDEAGKWTATGEIVSLPARTVCVAAGTSPNVMYEREKPGTFAFDAKGQYFQAHAARLGDDGAVVLDKVPARQGFFTSYLRDNRTVSYYGDNHPHYAGSVVKAMASAKDGYPHVKAIFARDLAQLEREPQAARDARLRDLFARLDDDFRAVVHEVRRLTPTIIDVVVRAPAAARKFEPGQFYRLQNFEARSPVVEGTRLAMEGMALTGAWVDKEKGLLSMIALEMGASTRLLASLKPGDEVVVMGPTGTPTHIPRGETVLLAGGGLGNAVLFSIARALRNSGSNVVYFAGYRDGKDLFKREEIEAATDQVIWSTDTGASIAPGRPQDSHFRGNIVQAMLAYNAGELGRQVAPLSKIDRIIAIGSDRMMAAVKAARHGVLAPYLKPEHVGLGSINSPMQCMMKEVCAQCLQKHVDPKTGAETFIFSCFNQDQELDRVDFPNLAARLRQNTVQEKLSTLWLEHLLQTRELPHV
jgi:NADPH-dependent glutamate synthase beta subunit-like oxidoreductase/NAD(P)H-flavin reductase